MKYNLLTSLFALMLILVFTVSSNFVFAVSQNEIDDTISAYKKYKRVEPIVIVPTVVELSADKDILLNDIAVFDETANRFEPHIFLKYSVGVSAKVLSVDGKDASSVSKMTDSNNGTYMEFDLPESARGTLEIMLEYTGGAISSMSFIFDRYVSLPNTIEIRAISDLGEKIIVANKKMQNKTIYFPETFAKKWKIIFTYSQPLRINEIIFTELNNVNAVDRKIRFLAQPKHTYKIYFDADRAVSILWKAESGNLSDNRGVLKLAQVQTINNPKYVINDVDKDGVPDMYDNCVYVENQDQKDINNNNRGDVCDDFDKDGLMNSKDNCPDNPNRNQLDEDGDGIGDVCDGVESRLTERYAWIPWLGLSFVSIVLIIFLIIMTRFVAVNENKKVDEKTDEEE